MMKPRLWNFQVSVRYTSEDRGRSRMNVSRNSVSTLASSNPPAHWAQSLSSRRSFVFNLFFCLLLLFGVSGCEGWFSQTPQVERPSGGMSEEELKALANRPLRVLLLGSPEWASEIQVQFEGRVDGKIEVVAKTLPQWLELSELQWNEFDVLIGPPDQVPALALSDQLLSFNESALDRFEFSSVLRSDRNLVRVNDQVYGLSLGSALSAMFVDQTQLSQTDRPKTWEQWNQKAAKANQASESLQFVEAMADLGAARALLRRGAALARGRTQVDVFINRVDGEIRIDSPPFVTALEGMAQCYPKNIESLKQLTATDAVELVREGKATAAIATIPRLSKPNLRTAGSSLADSAAGPAPESQPEPAPKTTQEDAAAGLDVPVQVENYSQKGPAPYGQDPSWMVYDLPASTRYFNFFDQKWAARDASNQSCQVIVDTGRVAVIVKRTRKAESAMRLIEILQNGGTAEKLAAFSDQTGPFKTGQLAGIGPWIGDAYPPAAEAMIRQIYEHANDDTGGNIVTFPALPGNHERLVALDQAVWRVLDRETDAQTALSECATRWKEITAAKPLAEQIKILQSTR